MSGFIFGTNNTGTWVNDTWTPMSGTTDWSNVTKILNSAVGVTVQWRVWANDTSNNWSDTGVLSLTTASHGVNPIASFTYSPPYPVANETVTFNASASYDPDGSIVSYRWDFGDGNVTTVNNPIITHIYTVATSTINYTVTLTVTDNDGMTNSTTDIVPVTNPAILHVSLPAGQDRTGISNPDPWLSECWLLNITGTSGMFTVKIEDVSGCVWSYDTHLVIALNDAAYNYLVSLTVKNITIVKSDFRNGTLRPYNLWNWPSGDVYPTWFNDTRVNVGNIPPKGHVNVTVSVTFSNAAGARMHFDAYGSTKSSPIPPTKKSYITHNPLSEDSTVRFWPPVNTPPVLNPIGPKSVNELSTLSFTATASDPDVPPQTLTFSLGPGAPSGASITAAGAFSWTPTEAQGPDVYNINITVSDGIAIDYEVITVTVTEVNQPPVLNPIGDKSVNEGTTLSFNATASDPDVPPQTLSFSLGPGAPSGASITSGGVFTWTPTEAQGPNVYNINITVSDGIAIDYEVIKVTVYEVNQPPVLNSIGDKSVNEGTTLSFTATATDSDLPAQTLTFSLGAGAPSGASITNGGIFTWTPTEAQGPNVYNINITVSDGVAIDYEIIQITVNEVNTPPVLDPIGPKSVIEGNTLSFTATASDSDLPAQTLTFSLGPGAPSGASITNGGVFSWTPTEAQGPNVYNINITVSDGVAIDYEVIAVTVNEVNQPPVLAPIGPKTVSEGSLLQFIVTASDPDIPTQTLIYSASNLPPGATFDPNTHVFSWTPTSGQAGVYSVHFEVSDGYLKDSEDITITVIAPPQAVGGYAAPIDIGIGKEASHLLASQIGLAFALLAAMAATILVARRKSKMLK